MSTRLDAGRGAVLEVAALVGEDAGEQAALRALVLAERAARALVEGEVVEQDVHAGAQQRVDDREQADGERALGLGARRAGGDQLAQAGAQQAELQQVARAVVDAGEHEQRRPAADGDRAERHQRLADRADAVAAAEERRVGELHQLEARPGSSVITRSSCSNEVDSFCASIDSARRR